MDLILRGVDLRILLGACRPKGGICMKRELLDSETGIRGCKCA
jgi:hypothetical protein